MKRKRALWLAVPWIVCSTLPFLIWLGWLMLQEAAPVTDYSESFKQWIRLVRDFGLIWLILMLPGPAVGAGLLAWERALARVVSVEKWIWSVLSLVVGLIWSTLAGALVWSAFAWFALATGHEDLVGGMFVGVLFYMSGWLWLPVFVVVGGAVGGWEAWRGAHVVRRNTAGSG